MIKINELSKSYKIGSLVIDAVKNVSLTIERGSFASIIGHSGSGKTTLLNLMGGLTFPDTGDISIDNTAIRSLKDSELSVFRNKKIGFIFQFASLIPTLTARENIVLPVIFGASVTDEIYRQADELLDFVGLSDKAEAYPAALSGGQQRRVAIARAFINKPSIIFADEPTGDLDVDTEAEIMSFFKKMNKQEHVTFVMVTHSPDLAEQTEKKFKMDRGILKEI